jgi:hypothetical protein
VTAQLSTQHDTLPIDFLHLVTAKVSSMCLVPIEEMQINKKSVFPKSRNRVSVQAIHGNDTKEMRKQSLREVASVFFRPRGKKID